MSRSCSRVHSVESESVKVSHSGSKNWILKSTIFILSLLVGVVIISAIQLSNVSDSFGKFLKASEEKLEHLEKVIERLQESSNKQEILLSDFIEKNANLNFMPNPSIRGTSLANSRACERWAEEGECEINPSYMWSNCQAQCEKVHSDPNFVPKVNENCSVWARIGECEKNPLYMFVHCKEACAAQPVELVEERNRRVSMRAKKFGNSTKSQRYPRQFG